MKKDSQSIIDVFSKIGIFSLGLFVTAFAVYVYSPIVGSHADENSKETEITLTVNSRLGLRVNTELIDLSGTMGSFVQGDVDVDVATNSQFGYTLAIEDKDDDTNMIHVNSSVSDTVSSEFTGAMSSGSMEDNTWGFKFNDNGFYAIPVAGSPVAIKRTTAKSEADYETTTVTFGAKIGYNLPAGDYEDDIKFTAYVNGVDGGPEDGTKPGEPGVDPDSDKMQAFDCSTLEASTSRTLIDKRDGNEYTVAKLADGRCWMTQNLRLAGKTISNADSDTFSTIEIPNNNWSSSTDQAAKRDNAYTYVIDNDSHDVLYNYAAATAGSIKGQSNSTQATESICPTGWTIPTMAEYENLLSVAGISMNSAGAATMRAEPYNYTIPGYVMYNSSTLQMSGSQTYYWTATAYDTNYRKALLMQSNQVHTSAGAMNRYFGLPVRCIARTNKPYKVKWDLAGGEAPSSVSLPLNIPAGVSINLSKYKPTRDGYEFTGWTSSDNKTYTGNETSVNLNASGAKTIKLTAGWLKVDIAQNFSCASYSPTETGHIRDTRDGNVYGIARLEDGRCWMTENLRLQGKTLTSTDTDIPSGTFTLPSSNWLSGVTNTWRDYDLKNENPYVYDTSNKAYGVLYNGDAAFGKNGALPSTLDQSICPKGWTLPTVDEFRNMYSSVHDKFDGDNALVSSYIMNEPFHAALSGLIEYRASAPKEVGSQAHYWVSKSDTPSYNIYSIYNQGNQMSPDNAGSNISGYAIRCIARE